MSILKYTLTAGVLAACTAAPPPHPPPAFPAPPPLMESPPAPTDEEVCAQFKECERITGSAKNCRGLPACLAVAGKRPIVHVQ